MMAPKVAVQVFDVRLVRMKPVNICKLIYKAM